MLRTNLQVHSMAFEGWERCKKKALPARQMLCQEILSIYTNLR